MAEPWASPYNSGTKTTEKILNELQGKTTELQSLDSQPTFGDMLDTSGKVQFKLNAKRRIAGAGINVKSSSKRKQRAFVFKPWEQLIESAHFHEVTSHKAFRAMQRKAHCKGVKMDKTFLQSTSLNAVLISSRSMTVGTHTRIVRYVGVVRVVRVDRVVRVVRVVIDLQSATLI